MSITRLPRGSDAGCSPCWRALSEEELAQVNQARQAYDASIREADRFDSDWVYYQDESQSELVAWLEAELGE